LIGAESIPSGQGCQSSEYGRIVFYQPARPDPHVDRVHKANRPAAKPNYFFLMIRFVTLFVLNKGIFSAGLCHAT